MPIQRMTAKKVRISDIVKGRWEKKEGMVPSFVVTPDGEEVSRARIMGTVVSVFIAEDGNFASLTIDDATETIRAKTFKTTKPVDSFGVGNMVDVIGKVREYNGEIYIIPEIVTRIEDPNFELLRKLEISIKAGDRKTDSSKEGSGDGDSGETGMKGSAKTKDRESKTGKAGNTGKDARGDLKREVIRFIESGSDGVEYGKILEKIKAKEADIESVVNEILAEGICYEPTPGKIKKI